MKTLVNMVIIGLDIPNIIFLRPHPHVMDIPSGLIEGRLKWLTDAQLNCQGWTYDSTSNWSYISGADMYSIEAVSPDGIKGKMILWFYVLS